VSVTVPEKPPRDVTVIVLDAAEPWTNVRVLGLAVIVKSETLTVTVAL
jgi:hypothetical protein